MTAQPSLSQAAEAGGFRKVAARHTCQPPWANRATRAPWSSPYNDQDSVGVATWISFWPFCGRWGEKLLSCVLGGCDASSERNRAAQQRSQPDSGTGGGGAAAANLRPTARWRQGSIAARGRSGSLWMAICRTTLPNPPAAGALDQGTDLSQRWRTRQDAALQRLLLPDRHSPDAPGSTGVRLHDYRLSLKLRREVVAGSTSMGDCTVILPARPSSRELSDHAR